jgi:hypothetical protein
MHKLVICLDHPDESAWPEFLRLAESMPGLRREATSRLVTVLYGDPVCTLVHELYFDTLDALQSAMTSPQGQEAGRRLQTLSGGRMRLFIAVHHEDSAENILRFRDQGMEERDGK